LKKLCAEWDMSVIELPENLIVSTRQPFRSIRQKKVLDALLCAINERELIFAFSAEDPTGFYIFQKWLKMNKKVYWLDLDPERTVWRFTVDKLLSYDYLKTVFIVCFVRFFFGVKAQIVGNSQPFVGATKKFMKSLNVEMVEVEAELVRDVAMRSLPSGGYIPVKIIVATEGPSAYIRCFDAIGYWEMIGKLLKRYKTQIGIKLHPALKEKPDTIETVFPAHYPVELLFHNASMVVGVYSSSLIAAARSKNIKVVISLIELVSWYSNDLKKDAKDFLASDKIAAKNILYPKTIQELNEVIGEGLSGECIEEFA
jgi:hypothetical protein